MQKLMSYKSKNKKQSNNGTLMSKSMKATILLSKTQDFSLKIPMLINNKSTHINNKNNGKKLIIKTEASSTSNKNS